MPFQHVLAAYDGSVQSELALDRAIELVRQTPGSRLTIVHAYHLPSFVVGEAMITAPVQVEMDGMAESERVLEAAKLRTAGLPGTTAALLQGDPARSLLDYAKEKKADLIVIGSRGLGTLGELFLGSVSHYVVQHAEIPVLVIKSPASDRR